MTLSIFKCSFLGFHAMITRAIPFSASTALRFPVCLRIYSLLFSCNCRFFSFSTVTDTHLDNNDDNGIFYNPD